MLLRCYCPYMDFFRKLPAIPIASPSGSYSHSDGIFFRPLVTEVTGFHLEIQSSLEALLPVYSVSYTIGFHPSRAITSFLTFLSFGVSGFISPGFLLPLSGFVTLIEFYYCWSWNLRLAEPSPHGFCASWLKLYLQFRDSRGYLFPFRLFCLSPDTITRLWLPVRNLPEF